MNTEILVCQPKPRPRDSWVPAARRAVEVKPGNHPRIERLIRVMPQFRPTPEHIAVLTAKYWGAKRVHLTVGFLDGPEPALRRRILLHMNARAKTANVQFVEAKTDPRMRIARVANIGYWSYVGTDLLSIQPSEQTMNLEGFTTQTDEKEFHRVVRHETGHTLGFPHEHMRAELVKKIDPKKGDRVFRAYPGLVEGRGRATGPDKDRRLFGPRHSTYGAEFHHVLPNSGLSHQGWQADQRRSRH